MGAVKISDMTFGESRYKRGNEVWKASTLYLFVEAKKYPVRDLPLWAVNLSTEAFEAGNLQNFIFQCRRVQECSLDYPILLDDTGQIADGYHRLCKAILEGKETIKAIRMEEMPARDIWED